MILSGVIKFNMYLRNTFVTWHNCLICFYIINHGVVLELCTRYHRLAQHFP